MSVYDTIETRFGMELEVCIRISEDCLSSTTPVSTLSFHDRFHAYFSKFLAHPSAAFLALHTEIAIESDTGDYFIYDIQTPFVEGRPNYRTAETDADLRKIQGYKIPIFVMDLSVTCGDDPFIHLKPNVYNVNMKKSVEINKSITVECITPILSFMGEPTNEKIERVLRPYLEFFGLPSRDCFLINHTAGCHVNISIYDTVSAEVLPITVPPLFLSILKKYTEKERELYYSQFRVRQPHREPPPPPINFPWSKPAYKVLNQIRGRANIKNEQKNEALSLAFMSRTHAIKWKPNSVLEFRVFQSERDIPKLIENTRIAAEIVRDGILESKRGGGKNDSIRVKTTRHYAKNIHVRNFTRRRRQRRNSRQSR